MKNQQTVVKSSVSEFLDDVNLEVKYPGEYDSSLNKLDDSEKERRLQLRRLQFEKQDLLFQRDTLKVEAETLVGKNEELKYLVDKKTRELDRKEKEHSSDLEKFKKLYDEMIRNISEEKNRTINKLVGDLRDKELRLLSSSGKFEGDRRTDSSEIQSSYERNIVNEANLRDNQIEKKKQHRYVDNNGIYFLLFP